MARLEQAEQTVKVILEQEDQLLELGRQRPTEPPSLAVRGIEGGQRLIIAKLENISIGRKQLQLIRLGPDRIRLTNLHEKISIGIDLAPDLSPGCTAECQLPTILRVGNVMLQIVSNDASDGSEFSSLSERPSIGRDPTPRPAIPKLSLLASVKLADNHALLYRLEQLVRILQSSASSPDFMEQIARTSVELIELDHVAVLLWDGRSWKQEAFATARVFQQDNEWKPSMSLLDQLIVRRKTTYYSPKGPIGSSGPRSLMEVVAVVAAPILDAKSNVIGAIYGDRRTGTRFQDQPIEEIDAQLVEILACGVAGGLLRLEKERELLARRLQFELFVTPEVARKIDEDPHSLVGRDENVTLLFCDIAGFSRISEGLSPQQTFAWINDVMESLTDCVRQFGGTIVDYVGDELIAMWGAPFPIEQPAVAACNAAIAMMQSLAALNDRWQHILGEPTRVGIGINSGIVRVGNTGSQQKLKYGPLGSEVNLASRIQGSTRFLRTPVLLTESTARFLHGHFPIRRLCTVIVKNMETPIDLYELPSSPSESWQELCAAYAQALSSWENRNIQTVVTQLSRIISTFPDDAPALVLLSRAIDVWSQGLTDYDPVWTLPSK